MIKSSKSGRGFPKQAQISITPYIFIQVARKMNFPSQNFVIWTSTFVAIKFCMLFEACADWAPWKMRLQHRISFPNAQINETSHNFIDIPVRKIDHFASIHFGCPVHRDHIFSWTKLSWLPLSTFSTRMSLPTVANCMHDKNFQIWQGISQTSSD